MPGHTEVFGEAMVAREEEPIQVFHDPKGRRWPRFKIAGQLASVVVVSVLGVLVATVVTGPALPPPGLSSPKVFSPFRRVVQPRLVSGDRSLPPALLPIADMPSSVSGTPAGTLTGRGELIGFYVNWDSSSLTSLKSNLAHLDKLIPEWLHATAANGAIAVDDEEKQEQVLTYIRQRRPHLPVVPLVNNYNPQTEKWEGAALSRMLADPNARRATIQNLLNFVASIEGAGLCLDFEGIHSNDPNLRAFNLELYTRFHPLGLEVVKLVPLDDHSIDYRALAEFNDYLILRAYDEHGSDDAAGPLADQRWYADALRRRFAELPPTKYVIAIGNYGYDWKANAASARELSFQETMDVAQDSDNRIRLDPRSLNPTLEYYDEKDQVHHVWFLDAVTGVNQLVEGRRYGPRGFALWRLGSEDPSIWPVFDRRFRLDGGTAWTLRVVPPGFDLHYKGRGEIVKVTKGPRSGSRTIDLDAQSGLIMSEQFTAYPTTYVITRWGGDHPQKVALTFDDGPDPRYTPMVLDVLRRYHAPATFFIIGTNATFNKSLIRRIMSEGHEIGNHTFTHPNIATISREQLGLEISATERLLESTLGRRSILFRPPYAVDTDPDTPEDINPLLFTSRLGYYTVEMNIDPTDWDPPGVDQIVEVVLQKALDHEGNVVLLHDGGGDRSQTVAALPRIIEALRAHGFELVTVSGLLGLTRDAVMLPVPQRSAIVAHVNSFGFDLINWLGLSIRTLFIIGLALGIPRPLFVGILAIIQRRARSRISGPSAYQPSVTAVVPAFNEEKVICKTMHALLHSTYPNLGIIVVDDGSTDGTHQRVVETFGAHPRVRAFSTPNRGKGNALNYGVGQTQADIIVTLDADTILHPEAVGKLVRHFVHPAVGAVAGNAKVGNRRSLLARWQALEYITTQNLERRAFDVLNCITVVPGAVGAWRRDVMVRVGGFPPETIAEDADLTMTILRMGYKIEYEEEAIGFTEAPETVRSFLKQRFRWMYGTLQTVWKHLDMLFRPQHGALGTIAVPYVLIFQIFFPLIAPVVDLFVCLTVGILLWERTQHPLTYSNVGLLRVLAYFMLFQMLEYLSSFLAFLLEPREDRRLLTWVPFQRFCYRQLLYYVGARTVVTAIKGKIVGWSKFERRATVRVGT